MKRVIAPQLIQSNILARKHAMRVARNVHNPTLRNIAINLARSYVRETVLLKAFPRSVQPFHDSDCTQHAPVADNNGGTLL